MLLPSFLIVKVIVVMAPRLVVTVKVDNDPMLFTPLKEVIVVDEVPSETTTERRESSTANLTSRVLHKEEGSEKVVWYW